MFFQYGVALHDLEVERIVAGETHARRQARAPATRHLAQGPQPDAQGLRAVPAAGRAVRSRCTLAGNADRQPDPQRLVVQDHLLRPLPRRTSQEFSEEETEDETRGAVVLPPDARLGEPDRRQAVPHPERQPVSFQIEHHLFPDIPAHRYAGDRGRGAGDLRALRHPVQHRSAAQAVRQRGAQDRRLALPDRREAARQRARRPPEPRRAGRSTAAV